MSDLLPETLWVFAKEHTDRHGYPTTLRGWEYDSTYAEWYEERGMPLKEYRRGDLSLPQDKKRIEELEEALIWCSASADFNEGGFAREGWLRLCEPLLKKIEVVSDYKTWGQMTPEEKGALLLAHHEGKTIEVSYGLPGDGWVKSNEPDWGDNLAYRVKPEPEVKTQELYWQMGRSPTTKLYGSNIHKITTTLENNEPVDIKIEKL